MRRKKRQHMKASIALVIFLLHASLGAAADFFVAPVPVPDELKNPWPAEWEKEFQARGELSLIHI